MKRSIHMPLEVELIKLPEDILNKPLCMRILFFIFLLVFQLIRLLQSCVRVSHSTVLFNIGVLPKVTK